MTKNLERKKKGQTQERTNRRMPICNPTKQLVVVDLYTKYEVSIFNEPGRVAQSVGHLTRKSGVLGSISGRATYFRYSFRFFKKGSCQLLAKVCARSTG